MMQPQPRHYSAGVVCGNIWTHVLAVPVFFRRGSEASGDRVSFCAPEGTIIQWDSECAIAEREIEHQSVNPITLLRKM